MPCQGHVRRGKTGGPTLCDPMGCGTSVSSVLHHLRVCSSSCPLSRDAIELSHPLPLPSPFTSSLSQHQVFSNESAVRIRWPKYWSFSFIISPSSEYSGLISFRIDWFDLLAVQGTLKSPLQHHNSKASILWCSAFFMVQLSHSYIIPGKTIALIIGNFVGKVTTLLFNTLSRFVIVFFPRSKRLLSKHPGPQH